MAKVNVKELFQSVGLNLNDSQFEAIQSLLCDCDHEGGGGEGIKKEILTRAEYTKLANNNALDEDTLYLVLEAQTETFVPSEGYDLRNNPYNDLTIDVLQPSSSGGGGTIVA